MRLLRRGIFFAMIGLSISGWADTPKSAPVPAPQPIKKQTQKEFPWLTGPLLTPSGHVVPKGHWNIEPYLYVNVLTGVYDKHWNTISLPDNFYQYQSSTPFQYGFAKDWDFQFAAQWSYQHTKGAAQWVLNDVPILFDYQLLMDSDETRWPAIRLALKFNLPVGKYQKLNPSKLGTDIGGSGNVNPTIAVVFSRLFHFSGTHFLSSRLYFGYAPPMRVHVRGLNAYGGGHGTSGAAYPGSSYTTLLGLEYTMAQRWALALDVQYYHQNRVRFAGKTKLPVGRPSQEQLSVAPALEYNWSPYVGIIGGVWFTVAGRNTAEFMNGVIAVNIYK